MRARATAFALIGMFACTATIAAPDSEPVLAEQFVFKNWATACDNGDLCRAVSLQSEARAEPALQIIVTPADKQNGQPKVQFYPVAESSDSYRLLIDRAEMAAGKVIDSDGALEFSGSDALRIARVMARGKVASLRDKDGKLIASASLAGANAAFRKMDALAGRSGTRQALVARGKRRTGPALRTLPVIEVDRAGPEDAIPEVATMVAFAENSACTDERPGVIEDRAFSLGNGGGVSKALVLISCGSGAYNMSSAVFIAQQNADKGWQFVPAQFDLPSFRPTASGQPQLVINANWDAVKRTLGSHNKSRGVGDCGLDTEFVWDGKMFRLIEAMGMTVCRGAPDWLPLWRAKVSVRN